MTTLKVKDAGGNWVPIAGDVNATNPINDWIAQNTPGPWIAATLLNSWTNYDAANYDAASYRKIGDMVQIRGVVKSGAVGQAIFTLPVGFRPLKNSAYPISVTGGAAITIIPSVAINFASGNVIAYDCPAAPAFLHLGFIQACLI